MTLFSARVLLFARLILSLRLLAMELDDASFNNDPEEAAAIRNVRLPLRILPLERLFGDPQLGSAKATLKVALLLDRSFAGGDVLFINS